MELVGQAASQGEALRLCVSRRPHVALVGIALQGPNGLDAIGAIHRRWPQVRIIAMGSLQEAQHKQAALEAGAAGYLLKNVSADELITAIRVAHSSPRSIGAEAMLPAAC